MLKVNMPSIVWKELQSQIDDYQSNTGGLLRKLYDALDEQYGQRVIKLSNDNARQLIIEIRDEAEYMYNRSVDIKSDGENVGEYRADVRHMLRVADSIEKKLNK